jgi:hypothetical protein
MRKWNVKQFSHSEQLSVSFNHDMRRLTLLRTAMNTRKSDRQEVEKVITSSTAAWEPEIYCKGIALYRFRKRQRMSLWLMEPRWPQQGRIKCKLSCSTYSFWTTRWAREHNVTSRGGLCYCGRRESWEQVLVCVPRLCHHPAINHWIRKRDVTALPAVYMRRQNRVIDTPHRL